MNMFHTLETKLVKSLPSNCHSQKLIAKRGAPFSRTKLQVVASTKFDLIEKRSWSKILLGATAPLLVACSVALPAIAVHDLATSGFIMETSALGLEQYQTEKQDPVFKLPEAKKFEVLPPGESKVSNFEPPNKTVIRVKPEMSDDSVKLFYMSLGTAFVFGCCYFGSSTDPFYDSEDYRGDGGDGTQHWFYNVYAEKERTGREKIYMGLEDRPEEEEFDEFGTLAANKE
eukprot:CAMPEP_0196588860 /NCGR_PEP_ID=MMETSP1081-20130531/61940_1 /TAXON_ID=36882 /ORGANISM="Pyramimonas amylifera, Strain CCMP720" /LENGTH=228 /DNA_ID=CAMNT_0041911489 /DNA_START=97 /DNA_END=783 /DNA_ORIENTATION=+